MHNILLSINDMFTWFTTDLTVASYELLTDGTNLFRRPCGGSFLQSHHISRLTKPFTPNPNHLMTGYAPLPQQQRVIWQWPNRRRWWRGIARAHPRFRRGPRGSSRGSRQCRQHGRGGSFVCHRFRESPPTPPPRKRSRRSLHHGGCRNRVRNLGQKAERHFRVCVFGIVRPRQKTVILEQHVRRERGHSRSRVQSKRLDELWCHFVLNKKISFINMQEYLLIN